MNRLMNIMLFLAFVAMLSNGCKKDEEPNPPGGGGGTNCPEGMTGSDCQTEEREQYIGYYEGEQENTDETGTSTRDVEVNITSSADGITKIDIETEFIVAGFEQVMTVTAIVNGNSFNIPEETVTSTFEDITTTVTTSGNGQLIGSTLTLNYEVETEIDFESSSSTFTSSSITIAEKQ